jgi:cyclohexadieny/prephenate dehydrogenase
MNRPTINRLALLGMGLIGSSIARAVRAQNAAARIIATDASSQVRVRVKDLALADEVTETNAQAVDGADLVVICAPVGQAGIVMQEIAGNLKPGSTLSDVASVKGAVVAAISPYVPKDVHFVPAHPVAGTEHSGPDAGFAELFVNRWCILTPPEGTDAEAVERVANFWRSLGSNVEKMSAEHHDIVLAVTSHLPHLIAYTVVGMADDMEKLVARSEVIKYSAGGFRDFTRIAASDPNMWRDVFLANKNAVLEILGRFNEDVSALARAIRWGEGDKLVAFFSRTRAVRRGIIETGQDAASPDFGRPHPALPIEK